MFTHEDSFLYKTGQLIQTCLHKIGKEFQKPLPGDSIVISGTNKMIVSISCFLILLLSLSVFHLAKSQNLKESGSNDISQYEKQINHSLGQKFVKAAADATGNVPSHVSEDCNITVKNRSTYIFQQILKKHRPYFIQFRIKLYYNYPINQTTDVFQPGRWYWTYGSRSKPYQFLSWDIRYSLYTFGLLDFKTSLVPTVFIRVKGKCNLTLGTKETSQLITTALIPLINVEKASNLPRQYKENYFCYLSVNEKVRHTFAYIAAVYFLYPEIYINYKCCFLKYNFTYENFTNDCSEKITNVHKWTHVVTFNIILALIIIAFCPLPLFRLFAWLGKSDVAEYDEQRMEPMNDLHVNDRLNETDDWVFANGKHLLTFFDVLSFHGIGLDKNWPLLVSRLRRLICLLLAPSLIYIELLMNSRGLGVWKEHDKITVKDFVDVGAPVGLKSLLGDANNRHKVFAPALGGPVGIIVLYFVLGFLYIVFPKSLKVVVGNGFPNSCVFHERICSNVDEERQIFHFSAIKSPLFFGVREIITLSQIEVDASDLEPGYTTGATLMRCNFYMLFTMKFWYQVLSIQKARIYEIRDRNPLLLYSFGVVLIPVYIIISLIEMFLCILYFGVPFFFFLIVMVRAALRMIPSLKRKYVMFYHLFSIRLTRYLVNAVIFVSILLFAYCIYLLVVSSFKFVSAIITYCFVAVIIFPTVSFGILFLFIVIVYYIIRQLKLFSYSYTSLLLSAVAISKRISETQNHVVCINGHLFISNVISEDIKEVEINGRLLEISQNIQINNNAGELIEIKMENKCYGIPKELYKMLIGKYRPIHKHVLSLFLRISVLTLSVLLFLSIIHSYQLVPDDQITEVMHVIFVIAVGALPKLIESDIFNNYNVAKVKIENKLIEQTVAEYWTRRRLY